MAHNVTGANIQDIYDRINDVDESHPLDANTFSDWSMQAGDMITVKRGEEEYKSPVHSSKLVWRGTPQMTISSTGNKERDAVSKVSRKKYGRGGTAVRSQEYVYKEFTSSDGMLYSAIYMSESKLTTQFDNAISDVHSSILQTAEQIYSEVHASSSTLYSYIDQTATYIESVVADINNDLGSAILQTASQIRSEVHAANSNLYSYIDQTATYISAVVENVESSLGSNIVQTAEQIYSDVHAANSTVYSYINQTATSITSRVENVNEDLHTEILQTQSMIRSAVWTANSTVFAYVDQTASYILDHVGERTGAKVFTGTDEPTDSPDNPITPGDLWLDGNYINFWDDADFQYVSYDPDDPEYDWTQLRGSQLKVWKDGEWKLVEDYTTLAEDTDIRRTKDQINLVAHNLVSVDGEMKSNIARIDVKADRITSTVNERIADVGSRITQTAYEIRAEVHSANSQLYSAIEQTATQIRSYVVDEINDLGSEITQTADQIRLEVHASQCQIYSAIEYTATSIRSYVKNEIDDVGSEILQTAGMIREEVQDKADDLMGSITVESNRISLVVEGTGSNAKIKPAAIVSSINDGASSIVISANHINLDGYVKATDITADLITTKLALASNVNAKKLTLTNNGYIVLPSGDGSISITGSNASDIIRGLKVVSSGNGYKLQAITYGDSSWHDLPNSSFSRAVSSWTWGGGNGKINVTALPQNQTKSVSVSIDGQNTITSNGSYTYTVDYENSDGDDVSTGATKTVTVSNPYKPTALTQSAKDAGSVSGYTKHGSSYQTFYYNGSAGSRNIRVYTYPTITIDGVSRDLNDYSLSDYLSGSPTAVYDFGYSEGRGSVSYRPTALVQYGKDMGTVSDWTKGGSSGSIFYYNGSSGNRSVRIYAYPVITIDGVSRNLNDYDLSDFLGAGPTAVYDFGYNEGHKNGILDYRSNTSGWWKKPKDNSGVCTIPNDTNSGSETWFSMNTMSMTRAKTYRSSSGQDSYYGKLYYWDDDVEEYVAASGSNAYWYYSQTNRSGTNSVYY